MHNNPHKTNFFYLFVAVVFSVTLIPFRTTFYPFLKYEEYFFYIYKIDKVNKKKLCKMIKTNSNEKRESLLNSIHGKVEINILQNNHIDILNSSKFEKTPTFGDLSCSFQEIEDQRIKKIIINNTNIFFLFFFSLVAKPIKILKFKPFLFFSKTFGFIPTSFSLKMNIYKAADSICKLRNKTLQSITAIVKKTHFFNIYSKQVKNFFYCFKLNIFRISFFLSYS